MDVSIVADVQQSDLDTANFRIPARVLTAEIDGQQNVTATGQRDAPDATARGVVTFTNTSPDAISVPVGTIVNAGAVSFSTTQASQVPPATKAGDTSINGSATVPIVALTAGTDGNVKTGSITSISGALAGRLTVLNSAATSGGANKKVSYLSGTDQGTAKEALRQQLVQQGLDRIHSQLQRNQTFIPSTQSQTDDAIEELTYEQTPEQVTNQTVLHMKVLVKGLTFVGDDVNSVVDQAMRNAVKKAPQGLQLMNDPLVIDPPVVAASDASTVKLQVHAAGHVLTPLNSGALIEGVRGKTAEQARAYLQTAPGAGNAELQLWPAWIGRTSRFAWRIRVEQVNPIQAPAN